MNVYQVITERTIDDNEIMTTVEYVTCESESISVVANFFERECNNCGCTLVSVKYTLTIVQHLKEGDV